MGKKLRHLVIVPFFDSEQNLDSNAEINDKYQVQCVTNVLKEKIGDLTDCRISAESQKASEEVDDTDDDDAEINTDFIINNGEKIDSAELLAEYIGTIYDLIEQNSIFIKPSENDLNIISSTMLRHKRPKKWANHIYFASFKSLHKIAKKLVQDDGGSMGHLINSQESNPYLGYIFALGSGEDFDKIVNITKFDINEGLIT